MMITRKQREALRTKTTAAVQRADMDTSKLCQCVLDSRPASDTNPVRHLINEDGAVIAGQRRAGGSRELFDHFVSVERRNQHFQLDFRYVSAIFRAPIECFLLYQAAVLPHLGDQNGSNT